MDRNTAPPITDIRNVPLPRPLTIALDNGVVIYGTEGKSLPVIRLEVVVMAGRPFEIKKIISKLTGKLIREGTLNKTSRQITDIFDKYGATIHTSSNMDYVTITLHCLQKYFQHVWPMVAELLFEASFPETELQTYVNNSIQKLEIDLTKPEVAAYRLITEKIFGEYHPYGYNSTPALYREASRDDLIEHYRRTFVPGKTSIHISGGFEKPDLDLVAQTMVHWKNRDVTEAIFPDRTDEKPQHLHIEIPSSSQSSLRIGRRAFSRAHEDYVDLFILNTVLGGFFGSRLNMNIREQKGMTYNIGSSLDTLSYDGCLIVMADMSHEHIDKAIRQVFREFKKLRENPLDDDELTQLKRYLTGTLINAVDGPFHTSTMIKYLIADQVSLDIWETANLRINHITPDEIMSVARKYLNPEDYWVVSAGRKQ